MDDGEDLPPEFADPPTLNVAENRFWRVFQILQSDRSTGFDIGTIPTSTIIDYVTKVDREDDPREINRIIRFVHAIDDEFVSLKREMNKQAGDSREQ